MLLLVNEVNSCWLYRVVNQTRQQFPRNSCPLLPFINKTILEITEEECQPSKNRLNFSQGLLRHFRIIYLYVL